MFNSARTARRRRNRRIAQVAIVGLGGLAIAGVAQLVRMRARKQTSPIMFGVTINKPPAEVYAYFRDLARLPTFMHWLESVREQPDGTSHWVAKLVGGKRVEWDAAVTEERAGEV